MTFSATDAPVVTRSGVGVIPDRIAPSWPEKQLLPVIGHRKPAHALDDALRGITARYGTRTAGFVAMQLEYPR